MSLARLQIGQYTKISCVSIHCVLIAQPCPTPCNPRGCIVPGSSGKNTGVGCHSLLQGIFPTQGSNLGLLHCRHILHRLSHQGSPSVH